jgi:hypothetical protein
MKSFGDERSGLTSYLCGPASDPFFKNYFKVLAPDTFLLPVERESDDVMALRFSGILK